MSIFLKKTLVIFFQEFKICFIVEIISFLLSEINKELLISLGNLKQTDQNLVRNSENMKTLEYWISLIIEIVLSLIQKKKIEHFKEFVNKELIYILTQVKFLKILYYIVFPDHFIRKLVNFKLFFSYL